MGDELLAYCNSFAALNRRYTLPGDEFPNVPTYISIEHLHQNGIINSSLVGVIIGDWKFYKDTKETIMEALNDQLAKSGTGRIM
ncbi:hypothetical protein H8356DRAFT_1356828 [Neocallimastix lanati (nom. inval.)]|nr:hypothetical protein H8356DRAFT_1356828 [Neocallimastix sp. JGI-2020a]